MMNATTSGGAATTTRGGLTNRSAALRNNSRNARGGGGAQTPGGASNRNANNRSPQRVHLSPRADALSSQQVSGGIASISNRSGRVGNKTDSGTGEKTTTKTITTKNQPFPDLTQRTPSSKESQ